MSSVRGQSLFVCFFLGTTVLGGIGGTFLVLWVDWTKWAISGLLPQLPNLPPEEAIDLFQRLAPNTPASIPLLVHGLCDHRPEVAQAAQKELQNLQQQWENQAWHQVSQPLSSLAQTLAEQKERLPPHSRPLARQLAEWMLAWRPPKGSPERARIIASCEDLLVYLAQSDGSAEQRSPMEHGRSPPQPSSRKDASPSPGGSTSRMELIHVLDGFRLPGGGLPVVGMASESWPDGLPTLSGSASDTRPPDVHRSASPTSSFSFAFPNVSPRPESVLKIRDPMEAGERPLGIKEVSGAGSPGGSAGGGSNPRLNQAVRLP